MASEVGYAGTINLMVQCTGWLISEVSNGPKSGFLDKYQCEGNVKEDLHSWPSRGGVLDFLGFQPGEIVWILKYKKMNQENQENQYWILKKLISNKDSGDHI